jgi:hypothetical protein
LSSVHILVVHLSGFTGVRSFANPLQVYAGASYLDKAGYESRDENVNFLSSVRMNVSCPGKVCDGPASLYELPEVIKPKLSVIPWYFLLVAQVRRFLPLHPPHSTPPNLKMRLQHLLLLGASAAVIADTSNEGHHGQPKAQAWVKDFDNLVTFGDR